MKNKIYLRKYLSNTIKEELILWDIKINFFYEMGDIVFNRLKRNYEIIIGGGMH